MPKLLSAIYEGNRMIRLADEPEDVHAHQPVVVMILPAPAEAGFAVEDVGFEGLREFLAANEQKFGMTSAEFAERFLKGELGDNPDYILWAGAYEIYQRLASQHEENGSQPD